MSTSKRDAYHHGDLRGALIALALETLEEDGPEGLTLRGLAERAGVSGMAPYRHFADKAALLEAVARRGFAELHSDLAAVDDAQNPKEALIAFGVVYVRFACARPEACSRVMFGGAPPTPDEAARGRSQQRLRPIHGADRRACAAVAPADGVSRLLVDHAWIRQPAR